MGDEATAIDDSRSSLNSSRLLGIGCPAISTALLAERKARHRLQLKHSEARNNRPLTIQSHFDHLNESLVRR